MRKFQGAHFYPLNTVGRRTWTHGPRGHDLLARSPKQEGKKQVQVCKESKAATSNSKLIFRQDEGREGNNRIEQTSLKCRPTSTSCEFNQFRAKYCVLAVGEGEDRTSPLSNMRDAHMCLVLATVAVCILFPQPSQPTSPQPIVSSTPSSSTPRKWPPALQVLRLAPPQARCTPRAGGPRQARSAVFCTHAADESEGSTSPPPRRKDESEPKAAPLRDEGAGSPLGPEGAVPPAARPCPGAGQPGRRRGKSSGGVQGRPRRADGDRPTTAAASRPVVPTGLRVTRAPNPWRDGGDSGCVGHVAVRGTESWGWDYG
ncbi:hypothetical protein THAOC_35266 [Thalassiosira oceanica]|uniref:Uncharacterized protein n=1 Tax=Thalassiosira oceanica TaxID=159749 RepID=K0R228_THAOC|nr:hypothetical protein THAOC_35266 [Thalassiosira oceanica]|eukprot:EJK46090.1 hypothetical protein THAOC_35266 [Thalassiosira oceanica]